MKIIRYQEPVFGLDLFPSMIDRFFDRIVSPSSLWNGFEHVQQPAIDVSESKEAYHVQVECPGFKKGDLNVEVSGDLLTFKGCRKDENHEEQFQRSIRLPTGVNSESIRAKYEHGMLEIELPKREEVKPRAIAIDVK
jgi:HSP20 family protein